MLRLLAAMSIMFYMIAGFVWVFNKLTDVRSDYNALMLYVGLSVAISLSGIFCKILSDGGVGKSQKSKVE